MCRYVASHLGVLPQVGGLLEGGPGRFEGLVQHLDARVPQGDVLAASPAHPANRQAAALSLPAASPVGDGHVDEEAGVGQRLARDAQEGNVPVAGLKALKGHAVLTDEIVSDVVVVQHHKAQQGQLRHVYLQTREEQRMEASTQLLVQSLIHQQK